MGTVIKFLIVTVIGVAITFAFDYLLYLFLRYIRKKPFKSFAEFLENNFKYGI